MYNILRGALYMTSRYLLPFIHQSHVTVQSLSVSLYNRPTMLFWKNVDCSVAGNIETIIHGNENMTMNSWYTTNEWTLNSHFVNIAYIYVFPPHSTDMTSWQSSSAEKILCNVMPFFYHCAVWWYIILYQTGYFLQFQRKMHIMLDKYQYLNQVFTITLYC